MLFLLTLYTSNYFYVKSKRKKPLAILDVCSVMDAPNKYSKPDVIKFLYPKLTAIE